MKNLKNYLLAFIVLMGICGFVYGIGCFKYKIWRAEHPQTETWVFFIPNGR